MPSLCWEVVPPPRIVVTPTPPTVRVGAEAELAVSIEGAESVFPAMVPETGCPLDGFAEPLLVIAAARLEDGGEYWVEAETDIGRFVSPVAILNVLEPVGWVTIPAGQEVAVGTDALFRAVASGSGPLIWTWRKDGQLLEGKSGPELALPSVALDASGVYRVMQAMAHRRSRAGPYRSRSSRSRASWPLRWPNALEEVVGRVLRFRRMVGVPPGTPGSRMAV